MSIVILGGGSVTAEYYLPALRRLDGNAARAKVVDTSPALLVELKAAFPEIEVQHGDFRDSLQSITEPGKSPRVILALPNHLHVEAARMALEHGCHVLCEKPLSISANDCADLSDTASRCKKLLAVAMARRFLPSLMLAHEIVTSGEIGAVRSIEVMDCQPFMWRPKSLAFFDPRAGGILADIGVHYLDWLDTLVGPLQPFDYSDDARGGTEASLVYDLRAAGEIPARIRLSRTDPAGAWIEIRAERGTLRIEKSDESGIALMPVSATGQRLPARRVSLQRPFADAAWPPIFTSSFCALVQRFLAAADANDVGGGTFGLADAKDAERSARLIEWAYKHRGNIAGHSKSLPTGHRVGKRPTRDAQSAKRADILVTGATGFIGGHLVDRLHSLGSKVATPVRSAANCANIARYPIELSKLDLLDKSAVVEAMSGRRSIYHLAYGRDGRDAARITIEGTRNVVEAAIAARAESVVVLSTMYVFGFPRDAGVVDETFPYSPYGGEYANSKMAMEQWCLQRSRECDTTRIVVLTPTCVFGPRGGAYTTLPVDLARKSQFCWIEGGSGLCNYIYVDNLVDAIILAAETPAAHGKRFIVSDGVLPWRDFLGPILDCINPKLPSYCLDEFKRITNSTRSFSAPDLIRAMASSQPVRDVLKRSTVVRTLAGLVGERYISPPHAMAAPPTAAGNVEPLPPSWLADLYTVERSTFSARMAHEVLGWHSRTSFENSIDKCLEWLTAAGYLPFETLPR